MSLVVRRAGIRNAAVFVDSNSTAKLTTQRAFQLWGLALSLDGFLTMHRALLRHSTCLPMVI